jgi:hypothetical protein
MDAVRRLAEQIGKDPKEGWAHSSGKSPMKAQLQTIVSLLGQVKEEVEAEHAQQVKVLNKMMHHQVNTESKYRVKKK